MKEEVLSSCLELFQLQAERSILSFDSLTSGQTTEKKDAAKFETGHALGHVLTSVNYCLSSRDVET